ncbi:hypothetical protein DSO57_1026123 [Entomophthora muscae]|uniref:Uncharacterized protein n=1 Tax=Entomophthora muscae TaxID=34485 RepID=A0ACC2T207_9FUNG|nr:hypothetical protein DSO57_1026123 [Entomophthora muscae]
MPSVPRAFQENRKSSYIYKHKTAERSTTQGTAGTNSNHTCYKCVKPGHMSRECKQTVPKDEEKSLVVHVCVPPLSPPSPLPPEDPDAPGCVPPPNTAPTLETADSKVPILASPSHGSTDPEASLLLCYPDSQEIEENQLHRILAINALTRGRSIKKEPLITPEAW